MAIFNSFTFDGENSLDYDVYITGEAVYNAPERAVEMVSIPGKNGALALDQGRFENIEVTYPAGTFGVEQAEFAGRMRAMRNMLASRYNYVRLTDSYHPDEYRLGLYKSGLEATPVAMSSAGEFDITFNCKPQRFLTSGEEPFVVGDWGDTTTETGEVVTFEGTENTAFKNLSAEFTYDQNGTPWKAQGDEKSPYLLRRSGGGSIEHDFDAEVDKIIGGTVAWNQLATYFLREQNGITIAQSSNGHGVKVTGTVTTAFGNDSCVLTDLIPLKRDNTLYLINIINGGSELYGVSGYQLNNSGSFLFRRNDGTLWNGRIALNAPLNKSFNLDNVYINVIDLTQMFGTEIADYIYSLEQTTSGSGIAWLKSYGFLTKDYYAYNKGSLLSVKTSEHKTVGFNVLNPNADKIKGDYNLEVGAVLPSTSPTASTSGTNPISVVVSNAWDMVTFISDELIANNIYTADYTITGSTDNSKVRGTVYLIDDTYTVVEKIRNIQGSSGLKYTDVFTPSKTGLKFALVVSSSSAQMLTIEDLCVHLGEGEYEPYESHSYTLDSDIELRGILKLDNGSLYYEGDVYESSGAVTRKYGHILFDGSTGWFTDGTGRFATGINSLPDGLPKINNPDSTSNLVNAVSNLFTVSTQDGVTQYSGKFAMSKWGSNYYIYFPKGDIADATAFKNWVATHNIEVVYELETPTTEQADPYANPQIVSPYGTEEYVDERDVPVPVGHETRYHVEADIIGRTDINIYVSPTEDESDATVYNEALGRTAYGGSVDLISGVLTIDTGYIASYNGETIATPWVSSLEPYASGTTPSVGAQVVYPITPVTYQLTPQEVEVLLGTNYVWSDGEAVTIEYGERLNSIINPTPFDSQPLVKVTGAGVLGIGDYIVTITGDVDQVIFIDCESMEIYKNTGGIITPAGNLVSFATNEFPVLPEGKTTITMGTGITGCEIIPRWWII